MDQSWEQMLEDLRRKDPASLTEADKAFLVARRSYLNADELVKFADLFPKEESSGDDKPLEKLTKPDLVALATSLGLEPGDLNKVELIEAIRAKQAEQQSQQ